VTYSNSDLQSKHFVTHTLMLMAGGEEKWLHEAGYTNASREVTITRSTDPDGTDNTTRVQNVTLSVDANGIVTMSGDAPASYRGFLSYDKKPLWAHLQKRATIT